MCCASCRNPWFKLTSGLDLHGSKSAPQTTNFTLPEFSYFVPVGCTVLLYCTIVLHCCTVQLQYCLYCAEPIGFYDVYAGVILDPSILRFAQRLRKFQKASAGRQKKQKIFSQDRGRYVKPMFPKGIISSPNRFPPSALTRIHSSAPLFLHPEEFSFKLQDSTQSVLTKLLLGQKSVLNQCIFCITLARGFTKLP